MPRDKGGAGGREAIGEVEGALFDGVARNWKRRERRKMKGMKQMNWCVIDRKGRGGAPL